MMFKWLHHFLEPHCPDCMNERENSKVCNSCEILKMENDRLRLDNERLLDRLLEKPEPEKIPEAPKDLKPILPKHIPWNVRRQMIEQEDREKARIIRERKDEENSLKTKEETEELEEEIIKAGVQESK